jgi:type II secretory pathway component GspD/PulD (secretin)
MVAEINSRKLFCLFHASPRCLKTADALFLAVFFLFVSGGSFAGAQGGPGSVDSVAEPLPAPSGPETEASAFVLSDPSGLEAPSRNSSLEAPPLVESSSLKGSAAGAPISEEDAKKGIKIDSNKKISLDLKGIDIGELFRLLSLKMGVTIASSKNVAGRVNIFLNNLTLEDALDVILLNQDLACERRDSVINVMTATEYEHLYGKKYNERRVIKRIKVVYAKPSVIFNALSQIKSDIGKLIADEQTGTFILIDIPEKIALMEETAKDLDRPLQSAEFDLKFAKSVDMKTQLSSAVTSGTGEFFLDERTGKVVVYDLPEKMKKIKQIVKAFDAESREVFIEAEIVQIVLNKQFQRGIDWEKVFRQSWLNDLTFVGNYSVAPALSQYERISLGTVSRDSYNVVLDLLGTYGDTKILSRPRIAAVNNQEARVLVGAREAYVTQTLSQGQSTTVTSENVQFIDVGVKLSVTPVINADGWVTMKIKPEVSNVRETITTSAGSRIPIVETSEAETQVKIRDGVMIMIAGLMREESRDDINGFPGLSKIPVLGFFLGSRSQQKKLTEIVIFLTPHIIRGDSAVAGTEMEKIVPPHHLPKDFAKSFIEKRIQEFSDSAIGLKEKGSPDVSAPLALTAPVTENLDSRMKGIKQSEQP